jgi:hypothetical protein
MINSEANPLAVWGLRRLEHQPVHFTSVDFDIICLEKEITDWIWNNLSGRFWFGDTYTHTAGGSVTVCKRAAFEQGAEASFFGLMLDTINTSNIMIF